MRKRDVIPTSTVPRRIKLLGEFDDIGPRGRPNPALPFANGSVQVVRWPQCPDCKGRGWYLINPFDTGCGYHGMCQCLTCVNAKKFYDANGRLPRLAERDTSVHRATDAVKHSGVSTQKILTPSPQ